MVESTALEMRRTGNRTVGSNPTLSATMKFANAAHRRRVRLSSAADGKQTLTLRWLLKAVEQLAPDGACCAQNEEIG